MAILEKNIMRPKRSPFKRREEKEFDERVLEISRVSRVVKGGRRIRFRALVAAGDHKGRVGIGIGKANEVALAVQKAVNHAKKAMITTPVINGTIPHEIVAEYGAAKVILKPASSGSSIVAGGAVRSILELAGISDVLGKILGSDSLINNSLAVIKGLGSFNPRVVEKLNEYNTQTRKVINLDKNKENNSEPESKNNVISSLKNK